MKWTRLNDAELPMCLEAPSSSSRPIVELLEYIAANRGTLQLKLAECGALLFRGFNVKTEQEFASIVRRFCSRTLSYAGGDAWRTKVTPDTYTANNAPGRRVISQHNELGYSNGFPDLVFFFCKTAATKGGATPLSDGRQLLTRLAPETLQALTENGVTYIQNFPGVEDLSLESAKTWQSTFETNDPACVDALLRSRSATFSWGPDHSLHVEETVSAIRTSALSSRRALFCQADRWHAALWDEPIRSAVLARRPELRYHHCRFGSGQEIAHSMLIELRDLKAASAIRFQWRAGDILCIDNVNVLHGRDTFEGKREVFVSMGMY